MCVMIFRPKDAALPDEATLRQCWHRNSDGGGIMWQQNGVLNYIKGMMDVEEMICNVLEIPLGVNAAIHFRIGTHGGNTAENAHPWPAGPGRLLMHNGIIGFLAGDKRISDSKRCGDLIADMPVLKDYNTQLLVEQAIGTGNKLIIMDEKDHVILNANSGVWDKGCWYSNRSYETYKVPDYSGTIFTGVSVPSYYSSFVPPEDTVAPESDQIRSVNFNVERELVVITFTHGEVSEVPAQEFITLYEDFLYVPSLRVSIDMRVSQFAISIERKKRVK